MKMMTRSIAAAALALATTLCAAQGTSSPAKKDLVQKILQHQKVAFENMGSTMAGQLSTQVMQMTAQTIARAPADKREALANDVKGEVKKFYDDASAVMREQATRVAPGVVGSALEEKFSEEELKTLLAWLESPVSRKFQQTAVEMQQALSQKVLADTKPAIEPKLKALEQTLTKKVADAGVQPVRPKNAASAPPAKK
jgi:glutamate-1-semialdehyde aminotransferase